MDFVKACVEEVALEGLDGEWIEIHTEQGFKVVCIHILYRSKFPDPALKKQK